MNTESRVLYGTPYSGTESGKPNDLTKVLLGALAGAAVGSIIGGLYTEKGIETRNRLSYRGRKIANDFKEKASDITGGIKDKVSDITGEIGDKFEATKEAAAKLFAKAKPKAGMARFTGEYADEYVDYDDQDLEISKTKVILAALAVSVAGTAVWSLTTEKGKETRKRVGKSSKKIANNIKSKVTDLAEGITEKYKIAKEGTDDLLTTEKQKAAYLSSGATDYNAPTDVNQVIP
jgi:gas vesicle protein